MTPHYYIARVKDSRTLELPEEAQGLGLLSGDEIPIFLNHNQAFSSESEADDAQERFAQLTAKLYAESDAAERAPLTYADPQKAAISEMIAEKHRKMGLRV